MRVMKKTLGQRFRQAREAADLTQVDIATECETDKQTVSNWERGTNWPSTDYLIIALRHIGRKHADANYILGLSDRKELPSPINEKKLAGCIEAVEEMIPPQQLKRMPPGVYARLIKDIYQNWPEGSDLPMATVVQFKRAAMAQIEGSHGGEIQEGAKANYRRRAKGSAKKPLAKKASKRI